MGGKLFIPGCNTPEEENKVLKTVAQKSVIKHKADRKKYDYVKVKTFKGFLEVRREKYEANKEKYQT